MDPIPKKLPSLRFERDALERRVCGGVTVLVPLLLEDLADEVVDKGRCCALALAPPDACRCVCGPAAVVGDSVAAVLTLALRALFVAAVASAPMPSEKDERLPRRAALTALLL